MRRLITCERLRARISPKQCATNYKRAKAESKCNVYSFTRHICSGCEEGEKRYKKYYKAKKTSKHKEFKICLLAKTNPEKCKCPTIDGIKGKFYRLAVQDDIHWKQKEFGTKECARYHASFVSQKNELFG